MILSNARLAVILSGPDLVPLSGLPPEEGREPLLVRRSEGQSG
jgi:hypothetical protein